MNRARWLWISAELPTTASTGRLVYSRQLAEAVERHGVDVTMVGTSTGGDCGVSTCVAVDEPLRGGLRSLLSPLPNLAYACSGQGMRDAVAGLLDHDWDCIVIDHLQAAWVADLLRDRAAVTVFVTHNHEATVRTRIAAEASRASGRRAVLAFDAWKAQRLERRTVDAVDVVTAITEDDRRLFERDAPDARYVILSPGWSGALDADVVPIADRPRRVGMLGSFEWHVKQHNLQAFLEAADPLLADHGIEIMIGGRVGADFQARIERKLRTTQFVGWVDDPSEFLGQLRLGVVAEPLGGGFKLKALDYVFHRVPMAVVAGSLTGLPLTPGQHYVEAPDHRRLARSIVDSIDRTERLHAVADAAYTACIAAFAWDRRGEALVAAIAALRP